MRAPRESTCPKCHQRLFIPRGSTKKRGRCGNCGNVFPITALASPAPLAQGKPDRGVFEYDAFISYRHLEFDRKWAKWIISQIETYRAPSSLGIDVSASRKQRRLFRDEDELPASADLNEGIESALRASRHLIVVCSTATPDSKWVNAEIDLFRKLGRSKNIIVLLIEGSPEESFPQALRYSARLERDSAGGMRKVAQKFEPLAADVRPRHSESMRHLKRMAKLRILAALLACKFDDLRQRHSERLRKHFFALGAVVSAVCITLILSIVNAQDQTKRADELADKNVLTTRQLQVAKDDVASKESEVVKAEAQIEQVTADLGVAMEETSVALTEASEADLRKAIAQANEARIRYSQSIRSASEAFSRGLIRSAFAHLSRCENDLKNFEWYYLMALVSGDGQSVILDHPDPVNSSILIEQGRQVATTSGSTVRVFDAHTGRLLRSSNLEVSIGPIVVGSHGELLVGCADGTARLLDLASLKQLVSFRVSNSALIGAVDISPDGNSLLALSRGGNLHLYSLKSRKLLSNAINVPSHGDAFFSFDGQFLVTNSPIWNVSSGEQLVISNTTLVDRQTGEEIREDYMKFAPILEAGTPLLDLASRAPRFATGRRVKRFGQGGESLLEVFDYSDGKAKQIWKKKLVELPTAIAMDPHGGVIVIADQSFVLQLFDLNNPSASPQALVGHSGEIYDLHFSESGRQLVSSSIDGSSRVWEVSNTDNSQKVEQLTLNQNIFNFPTPELWRRSLQNAISDFSLFRWRLVDAQVVDEGMIELTAEIGREMARSVPAGIRLPEAKQLIPWRRITRPDWEDSLEESHSTSGHWAGYGVSPSEYSLEGMLGSDWGPGSATAITMSPNLAYEAKIVNRDSRNESLEREGFKFIEISPSDNSPSIILDGHNNDVLALSFSLDGTRLFSGGLDGILRIWETETWSQVLSIPIDEPITSILTDETGDNILIATPTFIQFIRAPHCSERPGKEAVSIRPRGDANVFARQGVFASIVGEIKRIETVGSARDRLLVSLGITEGIPHASAFNDLLSGSLSDRLDHPDVISLQELFKYFHLNAVVELVGDNPNARFVILQERLRDLDKVWPDWAMAPGRWCAARGKLINKVGRENIHIWFENLAVAR